MKRNFIVGVIGLFPLAGLFAQPSVGRFMLAYGPQYHFVTASYPQTYGFTDILGYQQYGTGTGSKTSSSLSGYLAISSSLFNTGENAFFFGDYLGCSMGIGATFHQYQFQGNQTRERSTFGHLGFLGGLQMGYQVTDEMDVGVRCFYDFRWLLFYVGEDEVTNIAPFTLNWSAVGRYKKIQGDVTLGGISGYVNSERHLKTYSLNLRYLYDKDEENYFGTRIDLYRNLSDGPDGRDITVWGIGLMMGHLF